MYVIIFKDKITNSIKRARVKASEEIRAIETLREYIAHPIEILSIGDYKERK